MFFKRGALARSTVVVAVAAAAGAAVLASGAAGLFLLQRVVHSNIYFAVAFAASVATYVLWRVKKQDHLAAAFPDLAEPLNRRIGNVRDLMLPFKRRHLYRWTMRGSYSIKEVLPALVPDLSYKGLAIADGGMAMLAYHAMCAEKDPERLAQIRRDLLTYCELDTWAMVRILEELRRVGS